MTSGRLRVATIAAVAFLSAGLVEAQSLSFSFSGSGGGPDNAFTLTGNGTLAGGGASLTGTGKASTDDCTNVALFSIKMQGATAADTLTLLYLVQVPNDIGPTNTKFTSTSDVNVTAGTGIYGGKGGSGSATIVVQLLSQSDFTYTLTGTVNLGGPIIPVASLTPSGIVPVFSNISTVQPGAWISIYGSGLANGTSQWNGDYPTSLGGATVTIDGKAAYLWYVSPGQINLQVPDDSKKGCVPVVINTANGSITSSVDLEPFSPSLSLLDSQYVAGVILTPNGTGAYGGGTYDLMGPTGRFSFNTRPVRRGETVELFAVGLGPTKTPVPAGKVYTGPPASTSNPIQVVLKNQQGNFFSPVVQFAGLVASGVYQINATIPQTFPTGQFQIIVSVGPLGNPIAGTSQDFVVYMNIQ